MKTPEHDRLDLRQAFEEAFKSEELARIAMDALPPIDYDQLATKTDLALLETTLDAKFEKVDATFDSLNGELQLSMANLLRTVILMQMATFAGTIAFIARFG